MEPTISGSWVMGKKNSEFSPRVKFTPKSLKMYKYGKKLVEITVL